MGRENPLAMIAYMFIKSAQSDVFFSHLMHGITTVPCLQQQIEDIQMSKQQQWMRSSGSLPKSNWQR